MLLGAPAPDRVEVLHREADRVHDLVAARTERPLGVQMHLLAQRARMRLRPGLFLERRHDGRRRWDRRADDVLEDPYAALNWRRALRQRGDEQDAAVAEHAAASVVLDGHAAEVAAVNAVDTVVTREPVVDERVVRSQEIEQVTVLAHDAR